MYCILKSKYHAKKVTNMLIFVGYDSDPESIPVPSQQIRIRP
jgi:hypothetical protein